MGLPHGRCFWSEKHTILQQKKTRDHWFFMVFHSSWFTLWLFSTAMENVPFIMDLLSYKWWCSMAMLVYQRVNQMFIVFVCVSGGDPYRYGQQWHNGTLKFADLQENKQNSVENMKSDRKWICRYCIYPLVNQHSYWKSPFLMGKLTINGHFQ